MSRIRGSLERHLATSPANPDELASMARAAWRKHGIALLHPDQIADGWERQMVINLAERLYGRRRPRRCDAAGGGGGA